MSDDSAFKASTLIILWALFLMTAWDHCSDRTLRISLDIDRVLRKIDWLDDKVEELRKECKCRNSNLGIRY